jgi:transcriptional regulator with XRE-family HTH domain
MSGVSLAHLSRIEKGERSPSPHTLQLIAQPLGFDVNELLIIAGYLSPEPTRISEEQRNKLRAELKLLLERTLSDSQRIKEIVNRLLLST